MKEFHKHTKSITDRSQDSVAIYFHDIRREELISPEEEAELARIIRRGGEDAPAARERLIKANLKFVVTVANQYNSRFLELSDLISEGNIGLIKAAELFDDTKGFKFISYAVWWIRQSIMAAIANSSTTLHLPLNQQNILRQFRQMQDDMLQKEQRPITVEEFCEVSGLDYDRVLHVVESSVRPVNMDEKIAEDSDATFADFMISDSVSDSSLEEESLRQDVLDVLDHLLTRREALVVKKLYGIGCNPLSLDEIAEEIELSRERIRQICINALAKIRKSPYSSRLAHHLAA